jgi:hypothetical protein
MAWGIFCREKGALCPRYYNTVSCYVAYRSNLW